MTPTGYIPTAALLAVVACLGGAPPPFQVSEDGDRIRVAGAALEASIRKNGYVSGVEAASLLDTRTGARDLGFGLNDVD